MCILESECEGVHMSVWVYILHESENVRVPDDGTKRKEMN